jgi:protein-cysteine N-palmitoyltransferase HHAT
MLGSVALQMPTDLRRSSNPIHTFDVDSPAPRQRKGITRLTVDIPSSRVEKSNSRASHPLARWRTPEFIFYEIMFVLVVPLLIWVPVSLSQRMSC